MQTPLSKGLVDYISIAARIVSSLSVTRAISSAYIRIQLMPSSDGFNFSQISINFVCPFDAQLADSWLKTPDNGINKYIEQ